MLNLLDDIRDIVDFNAQVDAKLRTPRLYIKLPARRVRTELIEQENCKDEELAQRRTIGTIINKLGYRLRKAKNKPLKKIPETDTIFDQLRKVNREADETEGVLRLSMDANASVTLGLFSRSGQSRGETEAADHDFGDKGSLTALSILLPLTPINLLCRVGNNERLHLGSHRGEVVRMATKVLSFDTSGKPRQWSRKLQQAHAVHQEGRGLRKPAQGKHQACPLPFLPQQAQRRRTDPWSSRTILERDALLTNAQATIKITKNMTWKGEHPFVTLVTQIYETGVKLTRNAMAAYEKVINRKPGLEDWFVDISPSPI